MSEILRNWTRMTACTANWYWSRRLEIRQGVEFLANNFRAKIIDVGAENLIVEFTGNHSKVNALIQRFTEEYEVLELARTGITGLGRGIENVTYIED